MGIGMADFVTRRCAEKIDLAVTYTNALTALALLPPNSPFFRLQVDDYTLEEMAGDEAARAKVEEAT